jgi:hypothetical protein
MIKTFLLTAVLALATAQAPPASSTTPVPPPPPPPPAPPAHDTFEYCAQTIARPRCHGPAGAGPNPKNPLTEMTSDPSQWLCAGTPSLVAAGNQGSFCAQSTNPIGANTNCPAMCGAAKALGVPDGTAKGFDTAAGKGGPTDATAPVGGTVPRQGDDCYGDDGTKAGCMTQLEACKAWQITGAGAQDGLTFANEVPFADNVAGALHARCPGSVLKAVCPPYNGDAAKLTHRNLTDPVPASHANCQAWADATNQIPESAQWVEDYVERVYKDGYQFADEPYDAGADWTKNIPGYFHGIVPNYKTDVQLNDGQLVLIRIWSKDANTMNTQGFRPNGDADRFDQTKDQYDAICGKGAGTFVKTGDLSPTNTTATNTLKSRTWCWKRGKITIRMAQDKYVVQIDSPGSYVVKGIDAYDVRPLCFDTAPNPDSQFQHANCSITGGTCTNFAGTVSGFSYQLGDSVAKDNMIDTATVWPAIYSIEQDSLTLYNEKNEALPINDPSLIKCWPGGKNMGVCTNNAYDKTKDTCAAPFTYHYGMEIMRYTDKTFTKYERGIIQTFSKNTAGGLVASVQKLATDVPASGATDKCYDLTHKTQVDWDLTDVVNAVATPICYKCGEGDPTCATP